MDYAIHDAIRVGFTRVVVLSHPLLLSIIQTHLHKRWAHCVDLEFVCQETPLNAPPNRDSPWGTAHALLCCQEAMQGVFLVINADDFYGKNAYKCMARALGDMEDTEAISFFVGYYLKNTLSHAGRVSRGVCILDEENRLEAIREHTQIAAAGGNIFNYDAAMPVKLQPRSIVSMNFFGFNQSIFNLLAMAWQDFYTTQKNNRTAELYLPHVLTQSIKAHKIETKMVGIGKDWMGVTYAKEKIGTRKKLLRLHASKDYKFTQAT